MVPTMEFVDSFGLSVAAVLLVEGAVWVNYCFVVLVVEIVVLVVAVVET